MSKKLNKVFMAFATGKESTEGGSVKRYIGIGSVYVLAINPTKEELSKLSRAVSKSENEYFKALVNLKYFDEERLSYLISLDSTDFKEIRRLVSEYKEFIGEDLQLAYVKSYRSYIDKSGKLFANKKESREAEKRLSRLAQMILMSIRQNLTKI